MSLVKVKQNLASWGWGRTYVLSDDVFAGAAGDRGQLKVCGVKIPLTGALIYEFQIQSWEIHMKFTVVSHVSLVSLSSHVS